MCDLQLGNDTQAVGICPGSGSGIRIGCRNGSIALAREQDIGILGFAKIGDDGRLAPVSEADCGDYRGDPGDFDVADHSAASFLPRRSSRPEATQLLRSR